MLSRVLAISFCQWRGRRETEAGVGHVLRVARQVVQGETQPELQRAAALQLDGAQGLRETPSPIRWVGAGTCPAGPRDAGPRADWRKATERSGGFGVCALGRGRGSWAWFRALPLKPVSSSQRSPALLCLRLSWAPPVTQPVRGLGLQMGLSTVSL